MILIVKMKIKHNVTSIFFATAVTTVRPKKTIPTIPLTRLQLLIA